MNVETITVERAEAETGAVLANLVATWLAGFRGPDAEAVRKDLLEEHIRLVHELIPVNQKIQLDRLAADGTRQEELE